MKTLQIQEYECDICGSKYRSEVAARECESRPVSQDKGAKIGDRVLITGGDGAGKYCEIDSINIFDRDWGHYARDRYWHTVGVSGKVLGSWGSRQLTFDQYEIPSTTSEATK